MCQPLDDKIMSVTDLQFFVHTVAPTDSETPPARIMDNCRIYVSDGVEYVTYMHAEWIPQFFLLLFVHCVWLCMYVTEFVNHGSIYVHI